MSRTVSKLRSAPTFKSTVRISINSGPVFSFVLAIIRIIMAYACIPWTFQDSLALRAERWNGVPSGWRTIGQSSLEVLRARMDLLYEQSLEKY